MIAEQQQHTCAQTATHRPRLVVATTNGPLHHAAINTPELNHPRLFEFAANAPATLAERHPRLTVFAVSAAVLFAAIAAEIDCLRGSGYFWR